MNLIQKLINVICSLLFVWLCIAGLTEIVFKYDNRFFVEKAHTLFIPWNLGHPFATERLLATLLLIFLCCCIAVWDDIKRLAQEEISGLTSLLNLLSSCMTLFMCASVIIEMLGFIDTSMIKINQTGIAIQLPFANHDLAIRTVFILLLCAYSVLVLIQDTKGLARGLQDKVAPSDSER